MNQRDASIDRIREFNRFYTRVIGLLDRHYLDSPYSLAEVRILYEIYHTPDCTARKIMDTIPIDEGYLSRIINRFVKNGLLKKEKSKADARVYFLHFTLKGEKQFASLNDASHKSILNLVESLSETELTELIHKMEDIRSNLSKIKFKDD